MADKSYQFGPVLTDRIISVVRRVDGSPYEAGLTRIETRFEDQPAYNSTAFRICTFTGAWNIDTQKTVTFRGVTSTPNTVTAQNLFATINGSTNTSTSMPCAIAKDGTAWYLIAARCP